MNKNEPQIIRVLSAPGTNYKIVEEKSNMCLMDQIYLIPDSDTEVVRTEEQSKQRIESLEKSLVIVRDQLDEALVKLANIQNILTPNGDETYE